MEFNFWKVKVVAFWMKMAKNLQTNKIEFIDSAFNF
jgi:hypothetical protein